MNRDTGNRENMDQGQEEMVATTSGLPPLPPARVEVQSQKSATSLMFTAPMRSPFEDLSEGGVAAPASGTPPLPLKSALSGGQNAGIGGTPTDYSSGGGGGGGDPGKAIRRNVSWADFNDGAALTTVVEFERDPAPSSPTSIGSWDDHRRDDGCCCSLM